MDPRLTAPLFLPLVNSIKRFHAWQMEMRETPALKVFGGAITVRTETERNEDQEDGREGGADSSIIEGNLAATPERTMASFYSASVCDFLVDLITLRCSRRSEVQSLQEKLFCPSPVFFPQVEWGTKQQSDIRQGSTDIYTFDHNNTTSAHLGGRDCDSIIYKHEGRSVATQLLCPSCLSASSSK